MFIRGLFHQNLAMRLIELVHFHHLKHVARRKEKFEGQLRNLECLILMFLQTRWEHILLISSFILMMKKTAKLPSMGLVKPSVSLLISLFWRKKKKERKET